MALNDLMTQVKTDPQSLTGDESMERKVLQHVMKLVQDKISEVQNQAVKWCAEIHITLVIWLISLIYE